MSDAEVALELLKLALDRCADTGDATLKKEAFLQIYRECLAAVHG